MLSYFSYPVPFISSLQNNPSVSPGAKYLLFLVVQRFLGHDLPRVTVDGEERLLGNGVRHLSVRSSVLVLSLHTEGTREHGIVRDDTDTLPERSNTHYDSLQEG